MTGKSDRKPVDRTSQKRDTPEEVTRQGTELRIYQEKPGDVPLLDFLGQLKLADRMAIVAGVEALKEYGHRLRPPHNEHLGGQLYYLRVRGQDGTYRIFYWHHGAGIAILGHGFSKKMDKCPPGEIRKARKMRDQYAADPKLHTYEGEIHGDAKDD